MCLNSNILCAVNHSAGTVQLNSGKVMERFRKFAQVSKAEQQVCCLFRRDSEQVQVLSETDLILLLAAAESSSQDSPAEVALGAGALSLDNVEALQVFLKPRTGPAEVLVVDYEATPTSAGNAGGGGKRKVLSVSIRNRNDSSPARPLRDSWEPVLRRSLVTAVESLVAHLETPTQGAGGSQTVEALQAEFLVDPSRQPWLSRIASTRVRSSQPRQPLAQVQAEADSGAASVLPRIPSRESRDLQVCIRPYQSTCFPARLSADPLASSCLPTSTLPRHCASLHLLSCTAHMGSVCRPSVARSLRGRRTICRRHFEGAPATSVDPDSRAPGAASDHSSCGMLQASGGVVSPARNVQAWPRGPTPPWHLVRAGAGP